MRRSILMMVLLLGVSSQCLGSVPAMMSYQGKLAGADGQSVADGTYNMRFFLWSAETGGAPLWQEPAVGQPARQIPVTGGLFNAIIGSVEPLPSSAFEGNTWLETEVNGTLLSPRVQIVSTGYAMRAQIAEDVPDNTITGAKIVDGSVGRADIADRAINDAKIDYGAVNQSHLADNSVNSAKIANNSIQAADISSGVITSNHIQNGSIASVDIGAAAIAGYHVQDGSLGNSHLADRSVTSLKLSPTGSVSGQVLKSSGSGVAWSDLPSGSGGLSLPYTGELTSSGTGLYVLQSGTGRAGRFQNFGGSSTWEALLVESDGTSEALKAKNAGGGPAAFLSIENQGNNNPALLSWTNGTGGAGRFISANTASTSAALSAQTSGSGPAFKATAGTGLAGEFAGTVQMNGLRLPLGASAGHILASDVSGNASWQPFVIPDGSITSAKIADGAVASADLANSSVTLGKISPAGSAAGQYLKSNGSAVAWSNLPTDGVTLPYSGSTASDTAAFSVTQTGDARGGVFRVQGGSGDWEALFAESDGLEPSFHARNTGHGSAGLFEVNGAGNVEDALLAYTSGTGRAACFRVNNASNVSPALEALTIGSGPAIKGRAGTGLAGEFTGTVQMSGFKLPTSPAEGSVLTSDASGVGTWQIPSVPDESVTSTKILDGTIIADDLDNGSVTTSKISTAGAGDGKALVYNTKGGVTWGNPTAADLALPFDSSVADSGAAVSITNSGTGGAGYFEADNADSVGKALEAKANTSGYAVYASTTGVATAVKGHVAGSGIAGSFEISNSGSYSSALRATTDGNGHALHAETTGTSHAGYFRINRPTSISPAVHATTNGLGNAVYAASSSGDAGHFQTSGAAGKAVLAINTASGNSAQLSGGDSAVSATGDLVVNDGSFRGNLGSNQGAPFPRPAYVSDWTPINAGAVCYFYHNLGRNPEDYIVDVQYKDSSTDSIHNIGTGTDFYTVSGVGQITGCYWRLAGEDAGTRIEVVRTDNDIFTDMVRVRIWLCE